MLLPYIPQLAKRENIDYLETALIPYLIVFNLPF